jgi:hypothetical protein
LSSYNLDPSDLQQAEIKGLMTKPEGAAAVTNSLQLFEATIGKIASGAIVQNRSVRLFDPLAGFGLLAYEVKDGNSRRYWPTETGRRFRNRLLSMRRRSNRLPDTVL